MKKILLSLFIVTISFLLSSCSKTTTTTIIPKTVSRGDLDVYKTGSILYVTLTNEESLKFKNYTKEDFKIDGIGSIVCETTDIFLEDYYTEDFLTYYESQTMDHFKRKFLLGIQVKYLEENNCSIYDVADELYRNCSFIESITIGPSKKNSYYGNRIEVKLTNEESIKLLDYTKEDFVLDSIARVEESFEQRTEKFKENILNNPDYNKSYFYRTFYIYMNYDDEDRLKEDSMKLLNEVSFIESVLDPLIKTKYVFTLTNEESLKFKNYTKEDFNMFWFYKNIDEVVDLTYVYKEIIESNNTIYNKNNYHKKILVIVYDSFLLGGHGSMKYNQTVRESENVDFIEKCEMYGQYDIQVN